MSSDFYTWALRSVIKVDRFLRPILTHGDDDEYENIKFLCTVIAGGFISNLLIKKLIHTKHKYETKVKITKKQEACRLSEERLEEFLKDKEITRELQDRVLSLSFEDLVAELQSGTLTAVDVLHVYQMKALEVQKKTNCLTEIVWEAEELALERDQNSAQKGPLHGVPISVKESYKMPGYACTGGMIYYLDQKDTEENVLVQVLKKQGAVPFVRTNVPQTLMTFECSNSIYGTTGNPHDPTRIPGGSSGGEAALIGGGGSVLGMGSDIGGSVRIPAHMSGCCALKPSGGRLSMKGNIQFNKGQRLVRAQAGPMAAEVDSLVACMRALLVPEMFELDPSVPPIQFRNEIYEGKQNLTIGFYIDDGNLKAAPACQRAVLEVKDMLEAQGHTLVPFKPLDIFRASTLFLKCVFADGGKSYVDVLETDIIHPTAALAIQSLTFPKWFRKLIGYLSTFITKDKFTKVVLSGSCGVKSISEYWNLAQELEQYKSDFLKTWRDNKLDAVICPGFAYPAIPTGKVVQVGAGVTYTNLYNTLDYPAGTLKVTNVTQQDIDNFCHYPANTRMERLIKEFSKDSVGLPVGVQFVSLPFQEELVLRLMKEVETCLKK